MAMRQAASGAIVLLGSAILGLTSQSAGAQPYPPTTSPVAPPMPYPVAPPGIRPATPTGSPAAWATANDYPTQALRAEVEGTVAFRLEIGSDGRVANCMVTSSSGSAELDTTTCRLVTQRAQFDPARDAQGRAVSGTYSNRIRWIIPKDAYGPSRLVPAVSIETFFVETDGTATNCRSTFNGIDVTAKRLKSPCITGERFAPYTDSSGKLVRKKVTATMTITVIDPAAKQAPRKKRRR